MSIGGGPIGSVAIGVGEEISTVKADRQALVARQELPGAHPRGAARYHAFGAGVGAPVGNLLPPPHVLAPERAPHAALTVAGAFGAAVVGGALLGAAVITPVGAQPAGQALVAVAGLQGPNVRSPARDWVVVGQDQPGHPLGFRSAGVQGPNVAPLPQIGRLVVTQEQPRAAGLWVSAGVQGPNVASGVSNSALTRQETPYHPGSVVWPGKVPDAPGVSPVAPERRYHIGTQEQPDSTQPRFLPGRQGPNVAPEVIDFAIVRQEQPDHPGSRTWPGKVPDAPGVSPVAAEQRQFVGRQEQPDHPGSRFAAGKQGPNVAALPQVRAIVGRQDLPDHPLPTFGVGKQGPNVAPSPQIGSTIGRREQPDHPGSWLIPPKAIAGAVAVAGSIVGLEEPVRILRASMRYVAGIQQQGPQWPALITTQELPSHPSPSTWSGFTPVRQVLPERRGLLVVQQLPAHPLPFVWAGKVPTDPIPGAPQIAYTIGVQEPGRLSRISIRYTSVDPAANSDRRALIVGQETPNHPASRLLPRISFTAPAPVFVPPGSPRLIGADPERPRQQSVSSRYINHGPVVRVTTRQPLIVRQQLPDHPSSRFGSGVPGPDFGVDLIDGATIIPEPVIDHPRSTLPARVVTRDVASGIGRIVTRQEQPDVASPTVLRGSASPTVTVQGQRGLVVGRTEAPRENVSMTVPSPQRQNIASGIRNTLVGRQDQPSHPGSIFRTLVRDNVARGIGSFIGRQLAPDHPSSTIRAGVPPQRVEFAGTKYLIVRQENPHQPIPLLRTTFVGDVARGITNRLLGRQEIPADVSGGRALFSFIASAGGRGINRHVLTRQELPAGAEGSFVGRPNLLAVTALSPRVGRILVRQETPDHPPTMLGIGISGPDVAAGIHNYAITVQELPDHPGSLGRVGIVGPQVAGGVRSWTIGQQEQPDHPGSQFDFGVEGFDVDTNIHNYFIGAVELPDHPSSELLGGLDIGDVASGVGYVLIRQELPDHLQAVTLAGVPGLPIRPFSPILLVQQELPDHPGSLLLSSRAKVALEVTNRLVVRQELPDHPRSLLAASRATGNVAVGIDYVLIQQELPDHPTSRLLSALVRDSVASGVGHILTRQQAPDHLQAVTLAGVPGRNIRPFQAFVIGRQELPAHPSPQLLRALVRDNVAGGIGHILGRQEQPDHLRAVTVAGVPGGTTTIYRARIIVGQEPPDFLEPLVFAGVPGPDVGPPNVIRSYVVLTQEQPGHPGSLLGLGRSTPLVFVGLRIIGEVIVTSEVTGEVLITSYIIDEELE